MSDLLDLVVVTGAGGFIGGNLVADLRARGHKRIRAVDIKPFDEWCQSFDDVENLSLDLNLKENCERAAQGACDTYNLAANMGGMGFIENNKALCMLSVLINTHMLQAAVKFGVQRFFYSSSACVYNGEKQKSLEATSLKEEDPTPHSRKMAMDGKNSFLSACVATLAKILASTLTWPVFTTFTGLGALGTAGVRRPRLRSAGR